MNIFDYLILKLGVEFTQTIIVWQWIVLGVASNGGVV